MRMDGAVGWAKALARPPIRMLASRAPCPRGQESRKNAWARRTRGLATRKSGASAFAHPTSLHVLLSGATGVANVLAKRSQAAMATMMSMIRLALLLIIALV